MPFAFNKGVRVHYEVFGEGPPLFLHVGAGAEWDLWKLAGYLDRLDGYRLIVNDPRGRGRSDRPRTLAAHRMKKYVEDEIKSRSIVVGPAAATCLMTDTSRDREIMVAPSRKLVMIVSRKFAASISSLGCSNG